VTAGTDLDIIIANLEDEFDVCMPRHTWDAMIDVFMSLCFAMLKQGRMKYDQGSPDPCSPPGFEKDGRLASLPANDRLLRRCPKQPFVCSLRPPGPVTYCIADGPEDAGGRQSETPLEDPLEAETWGTKEAMERDLAASMRVNDLMDTYYCNDYAVTAAHYRLLRLMSRMYGTSRNQAAALTWHPLAKLGPPRRVKPEPPGDVALLEASGTMDAEQRRDLATAIVTLMRGRTRWDRLPELLGQVDDTREPILYDIACSLATVGAAITGSSGCAYPKPGPFDRRRTTREIWDYLTRLIAALLSPLPLVPVTFPTPTRAALPREAAWFPFWDEGEYQQHATVPPEFVTPNHADIGAVDPDYAWHHRRLPTLGELWAAASVPGVLEMREQRRAEAPQWGTVFPRLAMVRARVLPVF